MMLRGLTKAGLGDIGSDENFIKLAAQYGFQTVDLDVLALVRQYGLDTSKALLDEHQIRISSINLPVEWRGTEQQFRSGLSELANAAEAAAALECNACCTYVLPSTDYNAAHFMALATRRLRLCAEVLGAHGIQLGLEFVGPHHLRTHWNNPFIWTMEQTLDWIDTISLTNVGLLFDSYHWYTTSNQIDHILSLQASQIVHVHLNDAPDIPVNEVLDNGRVYPGEGVINLTGFLRALHHIGYTGAVSQEILTSEPPKDSAAILLQRSKDGYDKVFKDAGLV